MTLVERVMIATIVVFVLFVANCAYMVKTINDNGGVNALIIEAGKDIRDIAAEIEKHEPK